MMRTIYPNLLARRKANQEELASPGGVIIKAATQDLDERVLEVVAVSNESELKVGDTIFLINVDGDNLGDCEDRYLEKIDERKVLGVVENGLPRPIRDKVLAKLVEEEEKTLGGIILPDTAKSRPRHYEVVSTGPGRVIDGVLEPIEVSPGDRIVIEDYSGIKWDKKGEHIILLNTDIVAVLEPSDV